MRNEFARYEIERRIIECIHVPQERERERESVKRMEANAKETPMDYLNKTIG